ncbi:unnamed protein product [Gongylonema pulchrum]|uniref:CSN8_PSD8_EIF3K domain-containing protein n=1 Tax=Gongylonema pulchrum TaxID=637853 RepID=A0A183EH38_9BILA|nr:unnamed protein product [Gongylonema pulchrum]
MLQFDEMVTDEMVPENDDQRSVLEFYPNLNKICGKLLDELVEDAVDWAHVS